MRNTTVDRVLFTLILYLNLLLSTSEGFAQHYEIRAYKIQVLMDSGEKLKGMLSGVSESTLYVEDKRRDIIRIPLAAIRKAKLIDVNNVPSRMIIGAILGGLVIGYVAYLGNSRSPGGSRSPVLGGISIALGAGAGAGFGTLLGTFTAGIGRPHFVFRANGTPESAAQLYHLLEPYSETFQKDVLNPESK